MNARTWLLALAVVMLVGGIAFYAYTHDQSESDIARAEETLAGHTTAEKDALYKEHGMTFEEMKAHQRGLVSLQLVIALAQAVIYFGLWLWARTKPHTAALVAFFVFITMIAIVAVYEPKTILQGIVLKIVFTIGLVQAIKAGREEQRILRGM